MGVAERKEREKQQRRNDIIDAAEKLFFAKGHDNTTVDDIAKEAELSKGTVYLYFSSKEDLMFGVYSQSENYSRIVINLKDYQVVELTQLGVPMDAGYVKPGKYYIAELSSKDLSKLENNNINYDVLIEDVTAYYVERNKNKTGTLKNIQSSTCGGGEVYYPTPEHFSLGSFAGFYSKEELYAELDTMKAHFPDLISAKQPISSTLTTIEGREVYCVKISDNPEVDEDEPEMLYTALHHSREPASMQQQVFFMYYLLENYNNPEIKYLVDNTEMYFIPMVNPDGYLENEVSDPNGGGLWRKNKRDNGDGTNGVDLNRNYGYQWGYDNVGSSNDGSSDAFRGTAGFSEPETQMMKAFCEAHEFNFAINYHTYSDLLIFPYGYAENTFTPEHDSFMAWSELMTSENNYLYGTANQTVNYTGNGTSDDWMYAEQSTKNKIYAFSPEAGNPADGFWPSIDRIEEICRINVGMNLYLAKFNHKYAKAYDLDGSIIENHNGYFHYNLQCLGIDTPADFEVSVIPVSPEIQNVGNANNYSGMELLEEIYDSISYEIDPSFQAGILSYIIAVSNGAVTFHDTITKFFGAGEFLFYDDGSDMSNWTSSTWGTTTGDYTSPGSSITDTPSGNYGMFSSSSITMNQEVDLTDAQFAVLKYNSKWDLTSGYDFVKLQISTNNGSSWEDLNSENMTVNTSNEPVYTGTQDDWVEEVICLADYLGQNIKLRFTLSCGFIYTADGFYFDDMLIEVVQDNGVGIQNKPEEIISVYPNPAKDYITFQIMNADGMYDLELFNTVGSLVHSGSIKNNIQQIDISNLESGVYFYQISGKENKILRGKIIVKSVRL
jgi:hypothetical protein